MTITKAKLITDIVALSKVHHNIHIDWLKLPDYENGEVDRLEIGGEMAHDFARAWEHNMISDTGNRNLCQCEYKWPNGACYNHDIWRVYSTGRGGATLYWEKYWKDNLSFKYDDYELEKMSMQDLRKVKSKKRITGISRRH